MRVADCIAKRLYALGCRHVFTVTGGAAMHLNDAFSIVFRESVHYLHHEQSCSIAAESYARITGNPAVVNVTAGPGAINTLNGVFGAYVDSIPMIVISGQAKRETLVCNSGISGLRQLGDQEVDIIQMTSRICKYSKLVQDSDSIVGEIDRCFRIATTGRPGPVWLDIPIDVQAKLIFHSSEEVFQIPNHGTSSIALESNPEASEADIELIAQRLLRSKRPVLYVGAGIRISKSLSDLYAFLDDWPLATVTAWNSHDLIWDEHPCYCGRPGTVGNRAGNFAVQYADCVVTVGCRLNIRQLSYNWKSFAKHAWRCHIDIDRAELDKPTLATDLKVHATIQGFFPRLSKVMKRLALESAEPIDLEAPLQRWKVWRRWIQGYLATYPAVDLAKSSKDNAVNPYLLMQQLFLQLESGDHCICADGTACVVGFQAAIVKPGQRLFHNSGCASMGYDLPASIGAYWATKQRVICIAGDGSIMMNLQELTIISGLQLPVKIFLLNNHGYHSIRQTQTNYFPGNIVGCGPESGLPFPNFSQLAKGFGLDYLCTDNESMLVANIEKSLSTNGPIIHEIILDPSQEFEPKLTSIKLADGQMVTSELEDMAPFLGHEKMEQIRWEAFNLQ